MRGDVGPTLAQVMIVQRSLRKYREPFFTALRERLAEHGVSVRLVHGNPPSEHDERGDAGELGWAEHVPVRVVRLGATTWYWHPVLREVRGADLVVVEQALSYTANFPLLLWQRFGGPRVAMWGHGRNPFERGTTRVRIRRWYSRLPHWWFAYTDEGARVVAGWGFPPDRITAVRNTNDTGALQAQVEAVTEPEIEGLRSALGISHGPVGTFVGGYAPAKRLAFLLQAAGRVRGLVPGFELILVGSGSETEMAPVRDHAREHPWVHVAGRRQGRDLATILRLSDVLLVPGWVGLVAVDSFAAGVPLVTSRSGLHPPEVAYLDDGVSGLIVDDGGDPGVYADAVVDLLRDHGRRAALAAGARRSVRAHRLEGMVDRFTDGILAALGAP